MPFPEIDPVAFSLGPLDIRWYGLAYAIGMALGGWLAVRIARRWPDMGVEPRRMEDFILWAILGVLIGGRLGSVLLYNLDFYIAHPLQIFVVWDGGMAFHGGLAGVAIAMILFAWRTRTPLLGLADITACVAPIGLFLGRIANFVNGELWGRPTDAPWGVIFPMADDQPRHPSQLYEAALEGLLLFVVLNLLVRLEAVRRRPGLLTGLFLLGYGAARTLVEQFREPDAGIGFVFAEVTRGQLYSAPMWIGGLALLVLALRRPPSPAVVSA